MIKKNFVFILVLILSMNFISSSLGYDNPALPRLESTTLETTSQNITNNYVNNTYINGTTYTFNNTQMSSVGDFVTILESFLTDFTNSWFSTKTTDDLTEGTTNFYDNRSWNQSGADVLYEPLGAELNSSSYLGSNFTGSNGNVNRTLNTGLDTAIVVMERQSLRPEQDYDFAGGVLTIYMKVFDPFRITLFFKEGLAYLNYLGSDLSGTNPNKYINFVTNPSTVVLERQTLLNTIDYNYNGTDIVFNINILDQMRFTIWT